MKITERYQLFDEIGQGGMGTVYRAWDQELNRDVALKLLLGYLSKDETFTRRFYREAEIVSRLEHPHIVPIYDVGTYENRPYLVMRLLTGGTLRERIQQGGMSPSALWPVMHQVASALDMAHSRQVVHRDIKPTNILFDEAGLAHVADFGIARFTDMTSSLTGSTALGTPAYMSPEQFTGRDMGGAADQYALAVLIYEVLVGKLPFSGDTVRVMYQHLNEPPPLAYSLNPEVSQAVSTILQRGMAKKPDDRFPSVTAFVQALAGSEVVHIPVPEPKKEPRSTGKRRRNPDYEEGMAAFQRKDWAAAAIAFDRVLVVDPQNQGVSRLKQEAERHLLHETGQKQPGTIAEGYKRSQLPIYADPPRPTPPIKEKLPERKAKQAGVVAGAGGTDTKKSRGWKRPLWIGVMAILLLLAGTLAVFLIIRGQTTITQIVYVTATPKIADDVIEEPTLPPVEILSSAMIIQVIEAVEGVIGRDGDESEGIWLSSSSTLRAETNRVQIFSPAAERQQLMAELELPDGSRLFVGVDTQIVIQAIATQNEESDTRIRLEHGYLLVLSGAPLQITNPYGATASVMESGTLMGVSYQTQPFRLEAHCLEGHCLLMGDLGGEQILQSGESSWVGGSGQPEGLEGADYLLWGQLGSGTVPTATATRRVLGTSSATVVPTPTRVVTNTPRPRVTNTPGITVTPTPIPASPQPPPTDRPQPTNTPVFPTATPIPTDYPYPHSTSTPEPPTNTPILPTNTPVTPTNTLVAPTDTPTWPFETATPGITNLSD